MPELPDIETYKRYVDSTSLYQQIAQVIVKDDSTLEVSPQTLRKHVKSKSFEETERIGKHLFLSVADEWLMMHFGMTGTLQYGNDEESTADHTHVLFRFNNGAHLAYNCQRKLGAIDLTESPDKFADEHNLGPDALDIELDDFRKILENKRGMIKSALMDQSAIAGVGNVWSDEVLYQTKIHPEKKITDLTDKQIKKLHQNMRRIFKTSIKNQAKVKSLPDHYLVGHREDGADCPDCGGQIKRIEISGRGCYICPECQK